MSYQSLTGDLNRAARRARGKQANKTRRARRQSLARFAKFLWERGFQIHTVHQLQEKHLRVWAEHMAAGGLSKRTIANNMAHIRTALEGVNRRPFADKVSNAAVGAGGASRAGTKAPLSPEAFEAFRAAAAHVDAGVALCLELENEFGLRGEEAIRSTKSHAHWLSWLENPVGDGYVTVICGTKGGKTRRCPPLDRERAIALLRRAIAFTAEHRGALVARPGLQAALNRYHYVTRKVGMTGEQAPHSLRYAYACEQLRRLKAEGMSKRDAAAGVSTWLGHGDGRGTWVDYVYGRSERKGGRRA